MPKRTGWSIARVASRGSCSRPFPVRRFPRTIVFSTRTFDMLDTAFESLKSMDWGTDLANVAPIDDAAVAAHDNADARRDLENRLIAALKGPLSFDARGYVCRKLALVGSAASVPALGTLLADKDS